MRPLALLTVLFFLWGFLTSINDVLVPYFKKLFTLTDLEATLVQFAFFGAYFLGSLTYFLWSSRRGDPIARIGYQRGIVAGLATAGLGALLFWPASALPSYPLFLGGLFVLGLGFTLLQIAANPFVAILGPPESASSRLNLAQGVNSVGHVLGPLVGGILLFGGAAPGRDGAPAAVTAELVRGPYLVFALALLAIGVAFAFVRLPDFRGQRIEPGLGALDYPQLRWGVLAIFCYVGAEVSVATFLIWFFALPEVAGLDEKQGSTFVSLYWGGLLIGRFLGALSLSGLPPARKWAWMLLVPPAGYLLLAFSLSKGHELAYGEALGLMVPYVAFLGLNLAAFVVGASRPGRTTAVFALAAGTLLAATVLGSGRFALWCVVAAGLFHSVLWSNLFTLAIAGLGRFTSQGSSLLVMAIVGGAVVPQAQALGKQEWGVQASFLVPIPLYLYLAWYGLRAEAMRRIAPEAPASP
ncbi:MAG: sugar MFS transporter [Planctomycetota bacterium]